VLDRIKQTEKEKLVSIYNKGEQKHAECGAIASGFRHLLTTRHSKD
jgi:hypothetical protein